MLQELAELGMTLARAAAQQALADWSPPQASDTTAGAPPSPLPPPARGGGDDRVPSSLAGGGRGRGLDLALAFARLSRAVQQTIALEARIAAGDLGGRVRQRRPADPRLTAIRRVLRTAADAEPDPALRTELYREIDERLGDEAELARYGDAPPEAIMIAIWDDLGISLDFSRLPDECLGLGSADAPYSVSAPDAARGGDSFPPRPDGPDPP